MAFPLFRSIPFIAYALTVAISALVHKFFLLDLLKRSVPSRRYLSIYILLISCLSSIDLTLNLTYERLPNVAMTALLIVDGLLTGALLALLTSIYSYPYSMLHGVLTLIPFAISRSYALKPMDFSHHLLTDMILILLNLLHALYAVLNGVQTYMHRLIGLSAMCLSFYVLLFQQCQRETTGPLPIVIMHFVQSIRSFFLYSLVICIRHRTSRW